MVAHAYAGPQMLQAAVHEQHECSTRIQSRGSVNVQEQEDFSKEQQFVRECTRLRNDERNADLTSIVEVTEKVQPSLGQGLIAKKRRSLKELRNFAGILFPLARIGACIAQLMSLMLSCTRATLEEDCRSLHGASIRFTRAVGDSKSLANIYIARKKAQVFCICTSLGQSRACREQRID